MVWVDETTNLFRRLSFCHRDFSSKLFLPPPQLLLLPLLSLSELQVAAAAATTGKIGGPIYLSVYPLPPSPD
jgi:hypothetical protein